MIARSQGIGVGIEESQDALALVVVHADIPHEKEEAGRRQGAYLEDDFPDSVKKDHAGQDKKEHESGSEVRLLDNESRGHEPHEHDTAELLPAERLAVAGEEPCAQQKNGDFGKL